MVNKIESAVKVIKEGGIVAYPTEGVYGLGCDPFNETAVRRILKLKGRKAKKGLILIVASWGDLDRLIKVSGKNFKKDSEQPTTWIFPATKIVPEWITGGFKTVAVRVTDHPIAKELCKKFGGPIVSTSANLSGGSPVVSAKQLEKRILLGVDFVVTGRTGSLKNPTRIVDAKTGTVLRGI